MNENKVLNDEELQEVAGGKININYIYSAELREDIKVKSDPNVNSETVCVAKQYTVVYVLSENHPYDFVYCTFKGDTKRECGYIRKEHFFNIKYKD